MLRADVFQIAPTGGAVVELVVLLKNYNSTTYWSAQFEKQQHVTFHIQLPIETVTEFAKP